MDDWSTSARCGRRRRRCRTFGVRPLIGAQLVLIWQVSWQTAAPAESYLMWKTWPETSRPLAATLPFICGARWQVTPGYHGSRRPGELDRLRGALAGDAWVSRFLPAVDHRSRDYSAGFRQRALPFHGSSILHTNPCDVFPELT